MVRGSEQTFFQRHTDGQPVHEKMPTTTNHQGNENQNHNEISPHTCQNDFYQKEITSVGEDVEKREPLCTVGGNVNWYSHNAKQYGGSSKN